MSTNAQFNRLPREFKDRQKLKKAILKYAKKLYDNDPMQNTDKIQKLKLRLALIDGCSDMSLTRLGHLQYIFKHYCTHIFKTQKYVTFDKLQYYKIHMNMDRFFLFLKDFGLTFAQINGKNVDIMNKTDIVLAFKRISSNAKDVSFQQFITLIEKIGLLYYDAKQGGYELRIKKLKEEKKKNKQQYEKKKKAKLARSSKLDKSKLQNKDEQKEEGSGQDQDEQQDDKQSEKKEEQEQKQQSQKQQNDKLVQDMMNDQNLQDPNEQVQQKAKENEEQDQTPSFENQGKVEEEEHNPFMNLQNDQILLVLTKQEKIQFYYRKINVDSANDYKKRLSELNNPVYNHYSKSARQENRAREQKKQNRIDKSQDIDLDKSMGSMDVEALQRKRALQQKMNEKKQKKKALPIPKPKRDESRDRKQEEKKRRIEMKKQRQTNAKKSKQQTDQLLQKKMDQKRIPFNSDKKRVDFDEKQISWNVMNLSIQQLKLKQFNPQKFFNNEDDDRIFMDQYLDRGRGSSGKGGNMALGIRQRHSTSVIQGLKKRVDEVEKTQRTKQKKLNKKIGLGQIVRQKF